MARRKRRLFIGLGAAVLAALLVLAAAGLLVPADKVRDLVAARLSASVGREVTVASARGALLPRPNITLTGLRAEPGPEGASVAVEAVRLSLRWGPLLKREVEVDRLEIVRPRLDLRLPAAEAAGPPDAAAGAATPAPVAAEMPITLRVDELVVSDARITVTGADGRPLALLAGLHERMAVVVRPDGRWELGGRTRLDTLRLHLPQGELGEGIPITLDKTLSFDPDGGRLEITRAQLALGDLPLAVNGTLTGLDRGAPVADLEMSGGPVAVGSLLGFLPAGLVPAAAEVRSSGTLALAATVAGSLLMADAADLAWTLRFALTEGTVAHPELPAEITGLAVILSADPAAVRIETLTARTPRSRLAASGTIADAAGDPAYDLTVEADVDLAEVMALLPPQPEQPTVSGQAQARMRLQGGAGDPASLQPAGTLSLTGVTLSGPAFALPVTDLHARGRLDGDRLRLDAARCRYGRSDLAVSGTADGLRALLPRADGAAVAVATLELELTGALLDLDEMVAANAAVRAPVATGTGAGSPESAGAPADRTAVLEHLAPLVGAVRVEIGELRLRGNRLTRLTGTARLDRGLITLERTRARAYGGDATLGGTVDLRDRRAGNLDLTFAVTGARAEKFFAETTTAGRLARLAPGLVGGIDASGTFGGALDDTLGMVPASLVSSGQLAIHEAALSGLPVQTRLAALLDAPQLEVLRFADWLQPWRIENGRLTVDDLELTAGPVTIKGSGWQGLDGSLGAAVDLQLPAAWAGGLRRRLPAGLSAILLDDPAAPLLVPVTVGGTRDEPVVGLDADRLAAAANARLEAQVAAEQERLRQRILDEATRGLTDLLGAPADSAAADSSQPQSLEDVGRSLLDRLRGGPKGGGG